MRVQVALAVLGAAAVCRLGYDHAYGSSQTGIPPRKPFAGFPADAAGSEWKGGWNPLAPAVARKAGVSEHVRISYRREGLPFEFYAGYYDGSAIEAIHQPEVCLPSSGWTRLTGEEVTLPSAGGKPVVLNLVTFEHEGQKILTAYTFYYRGRYEPREWTIYRGRAFGPRHYAVLTFSTHLGARSDLKRPRDLLRELVGSLAPVVEEYLPEEKIP